MGKYTTILFDLGATLIYFDAAWEPVLMESARALTRKLEELGFQFTHANFAEEYRETARQFYRQREDDLREYPSSHVLNQALSNHGYTQTDETTLHCALKAMYAVSESHWHAEPDALPMLQALRQKGYQIGLVSNATDDDDVQALIDQHQFRPYFDYIISSAVAGVRKPHSLIFQMALQHLEADPAHTAMVGDYLELDILGANRLGMGSVWINRRADLLNAEKYLATIHPGRTISTLSELPAVLDNWE